MSSNPFSSQQTAHKYTFQLQLKKLYVNPCFPFDVKIVWARGQQRIQSQNPIKLQPHDNQIALHECFCNKSTVLFNKKNKEFKKKQSKIQIILYANGSPKQGGQYILNLCEILDPYDLRKSQQKTYRVITRQQKPHCQIQFKITADYCQQMQKDEQRSIGSGIASISSKNTTSMSNMGMPVSDQKYYVEKKNLFLCQAPSKDNQSVASYTSYGTNIMRYGSNRKQNESTSVKKEDHGKSKRDSVDLFSKTGNMRSNISQEYDLKSKNGSYNRYTQPNYDKFDNKTQNFDQSINKQLLDQQARRSKLQADVSRLQIYSKEQKNKLNQIITENTKLKQQLTRLNNQQQSTKPAIQSAKQHYQDLIQKLKRQNNDLHNRAYQLNNENRQLHRKFDNIIQEKETLQDECRRFRLQKERLQTKYQTLNKSMEGIVNNRQHSSKQLENLRDQLEHIKSLNVNLRENLEKEKRKVQQLEYNKSFETSHVEEGLKKKQQKIYQLQKQRMTLLNQLDSRNSEIQHKNDILYRLQKTNQQYKNKIVQNQSQKNSLFDDNKYLKQQNQKMRKQLSYLNDSLLKMRDQKAAQYEQKNTHLESMNYQFQQKIKNLENQNEQNKKSYNQMLGMNETIKRELQDKKNQIYRLEANIRGLREFENKYYGLDKALGEKQRELTYAKQQNNQLLYKIGELQDSSRKLTFQLEDTRRKVKQNPHPDVDVNEILRESVQMQVQLKFKTDELVRLKNIQQKYEDIKYRLQIQEKNRLQLEQDLQKIQKELKQKNKLYLIQIEKGKLMIKEKSDKEKELQSVRGQLKHCQQIIYKGDRQVKQMEGHIQYLEGEKAKFTQKIEVLEQQLNMTKIKAADTSRFQNRIKQLEKQLSEKGYTVNLLTNNLSSSKKQIQQLQYQIHNRQNEIQQKKKSQQMSSKKIIELQQTKNVVTNELQKILAQKKSIQLKNQMIMQQFYTLKKQFQEQKGRSTSIVSMRSSQEQNKIRQLQNQLQKKEKAISKLTKQKLQIEEENINLHVQVMKKLSEMEKSKDSHQQQSASSLSSTQKIIYQTPKGHQQK